MTGPAATPLAPSLAREPGSPGDAQVGAPAGGRVPTRSRRLRARLLPRGVHLPEAAWRARHRAVCAFLCVLTGATVVAAVLAHGGWYVAVEAALMVVFAAGAVAVPQHRRRLASSVVSVAMLTATAILVHLSGGLIEMHFLFFVIVAAVTVYQQWAPFLSAVGFVVLHHGIIGTMHPGATYNHEAAIQNPWLWAGVHGGFVALASVVGLATWRFDELVREELHLAGERTRVVLDSVGDSVLALDGDGRVLTANTRTALLLSRPAEDLVGGHVHDLLHPHTGHGRAGCPLARVEPGGTSTGVDVVLPAPAGGPAAGGSGADGAPAPQVGDTAAGGTRGGDGDVRVPVRYRVVAVEGDREARAVLTLTDISGDERARLAERRLLDLSVQRRAERAEVEQLVASVGPRPLDVPGLELAATYLPASQVLIGGDLYDWLVAPDGTVHVTVIDAMGKGVAATQQAIAVLHALRVLSLEEVPLAELFARADRVLSRHDPELAASAVVGRYRPDTGALQVASAGHPPALVVRADGSWRYLESVGVGIGFPGAGSSVLADTVLDHGDTLVLYTDGLIEGTRDLDRGLSDLGRTAGGLATAPADVMATQLVREPGSVSAKDDRVALVMRRR